MLGDRANCRLAYRENGLGVALWLCWRWRKRPWASINWWCLLPKRLVLTVCNTSGWEWSWSKWFWYFCQLCVNSKMHLPIASNTDSKLAPRSGSVSKDIRRASCSSGLCGISYLQKLRDIYADIRYCWNLLCVIVTWHVCLKWTWWPIIFLWCLLYSSRQAGNDLVGDVVCFLAKLIADPVLT